jgi:hypothetical protein
MLVMTLHPSPWPNECQRIGRGELEDRGQTPVWSTPPWLVHDVPLALIYKTENEEEMNKNVVSHYTALLKCKQKCASSL